MSLEDDPNFVRLQSQVIANTGEIQRIDSEVKDMKTDIKDDFGEVKTEVRAMNGTLTDMKAITETMAENVRLTGEHQVLRADSHAKDIREIQKDNKTRDKSITKNSQISGWLAAGVGAISLVIFAAFVKYLAGG